MIISKGLSSSCSRQGFFLSNHRYFSIFGIYVSNAISPSRTGLYSFLHITNVLRLFLQLNACVYHFSKSPEIWSYFGRKIAGKIVCPKRDASANLSK